MRDWIHKGFAIGFFAIATLFFFWAMANNLNDILIRQFQKALALSRGESGFLQFVFYLGYFVVALPAGLLIARLGYRAGILVGLAFYATGALLFYPAAEIREYWAFLGALFIIASGLAILETAANPLIARFGPERFAAQRLNLAQAFNGFGAFLAPVVGGIFIFSGVELDTSQLAQMSSSELESYRESEARMVQAPYLALAGAITIIALLIAFVRLPETEGGGTDRQSAANNAKQRPGLIEPLRIPHLRAAIVAQFFYVGAQVAIWSFFVDFAIEAGSGINEKSAAFLLSLSLASFMIGRFLGTALMGRIAPAKLLSTFAIIACLLCLISLFTSGNVALVALGATSFFMSIMFPTIFALGIERTGECTALGSSYLIMAIIGGALFPPASGYLADLTNDIHTIALLPAISFLAVTIFALRYPALLRA